MGDNEIEKCNETIKDKVLQKKVTSIIYSLKLEGITKNIQGIFKLLLPAMQNIKGISLNFRCINPVKKYLACRKIF